MPEHDTIHADASPNTQASLTADLRALGLNAGDVVIVHSALKRIGWTAGGAEAVCRALLDAVTPGGTIMMPTHCSDNSDPSHWQHPPVPEAWWPTIRDHMPPFNPATTPTWQMGVIPELFRTFPGARRSAHPAGSFAALGPHAERLIAHHALDSMFGEESPLAALADLDGAVLLLGVDHGNNTLLHLAEHRAAYAGKQVVTDAAAMLIDGVRVWQPYPLLDYNADDFAALGLAYEMHIGYTPGRVGQAEARLLRARPLLDFAITWLEANRRAQG